MSYLRIQTTVKKPGKDPNRKNARKETKEYTYVYEIVSYRGRVKRKQEKTKRRRYKSINHDIKTKLGPYHELKPKYKNTLDLDKTKSLSKNEFLKKVISCNLIVHSFVKTKSEIYECDKFIVDLKQYNVRSKINNKEVVLGIYEGFLCKTTLIRLFELNVKTRDDIPLLAKYVRDIGLIQIKDSFENCQGFLSTLLSKYPSFTEKTEIVSLDEFKEKEGY